MVRSRVALALFALVAFACDDNPTGPRFGYVQLLVQTTGSDPDDAYEITSDTVRLSILPNASSTYQMPEGRRSFELKGVAENCLVEGSSTASVNISKNDTAHVVFKVGCAATGITVITQTAGGDFPSAFQVFVQSLPTFAIPPNGSQTYTRVSPGQHQVRLSTGAPNCQINGDSAVSVDVVNRQITPVQFKVQCVLAARTGVIAFVDYSRSSTIVVMNPDGSNQGDLNHGYQPSWSRDGTKLVYSATECDYYTYLCTGSLAVVDPITRQITNLTAARFGYSPDWSPTEDVIVYVNGETYRPYLFDVATSTSTPINIPENIITYHPSWSPDGTQIVASCFPAGGNSGLCIFNRDGSGFRLIPTGFGDASFLGDPSWSPDGTRIVFWKYSPAQTIYTIKPDGTDPRSIVAGASASWSPDGSEIIFAAQNGLFTIGQTGTPRRLTTGNHYSPVWRP